MIVSLDQIGQEIELSEYPKRIISLVPSQTELLFDLNLEDEVVGITKFCVHPSSWFSSKTKVGGTKNVNIEKISTLQPDLIICNKEENVQSQVEDLKKIAPVWISDINSLEDALNMIHSISELTNRTDLGRNIISEISSNFRHIESINNKSVLYFIWNNPMMLAGQGTFINSMLESIGLKNECNSIRYPDLGNIDYSNPDYIFLSSEPFPFNDSHVKLFQEKFPDSKVILVDGEFFSWYGSRMVKATNYFKSLKANL